MGRLSETIVDPETVAAARRGDTAAREALFNAVAGNAFGLIRRIVRHKALAEDLLQDTLIAMYEHLEQFRDDAPFGAWVQAIAVRRCLMALRSPWNRARVALDGFANAEANELAARDARLPEMIDAERALAALTPRARLVIWLYEVEGWSHQEIATSFGRSVSFSKSAVARAKAQLVAGRDLPAASSPLSIY